MVNEMMKDAPTETRTEALKVAVLYGGTSSEREISLQSGQAVIDALQGFEQDGEKLFDVLPIDVDENFLQQALNLKQSSVDRVFIALHGGAGEDGSVQAVLDMAQLSYTGSDVLASALALNKLKTKQLWKAEKINTPAYQVLQNTTTWSDLSSQLGHKVIIKPASEGSSIGMRIASDAESLSQAIDEAFQYDTEVIAEQWVDGDEFTVAILAERALPVIKLKTNNVFYDFEAKYQSDDTQYICPCGLSSEEEKQMQDLALSAFDALGCSGWGRVDVMRDKQGNNYLLEANTVPGLTSHSLVPMAAKIDGMDFQKLIVNILQA